MRSFQDIVVDKVKEIDRFLDTSPIIYKGFNLKELLVTERYVYSDQISFKQRLKNIIKLAIIDYLPRKNKLFEKRNYSSRRTFKYIFSFPYKLSLIHFSSILLNLISEVKNKNEILVVVSSESTYNYFNRNNISCHLVSLPRLPYFSIKPAEKFRIAEKIFLENGKLLLDFAEKLFDRTKPKTLLTAEDSDYFNQCFTKIAGRKKILSITHQHGLILDLPLTLWKFLFSDYMIVWGDTSKEHFSQYIPSQKLIPLGTDKFNHLTNARNDDIERKFITLAVNELRGFPGYKKTAIKLLTKVLQKLEKIYSHIKGFTFVVKLHPAMDESEWRIRVQKIISDYSLSSDYLVISKADNADLLHKSKFLIYTESTIFLEAQICDCSLIKVYISETEKGTDKTFIGDLHNELRKRLADSEYDNEVLKKQRKELKSHIADFHSSKAEIKFIDSLI